MVTMDDEWQDNSERNSNAKNGEENRERKSFNPNFTPDNHLRKPRRRIGETRVNVSSLNDQQGSRSYGGQQGGYNRQNGQQGYNRYNNNGGQSGYNRYNNNNDNQGGYNRYNNDNQGGYNRYNNDNQGGYNRNNNNGYNINNGGQGGYNRNNNNGYNINNGGQGGYNRNNNNGGGYNRNNGYNNQGGNRNNGGMNNNRRQQNGQQRFNNNNNNRARNNDHRPVEYKSIAVDPTESLRLNKFLANAGVCSRREADELIQGAAVQVNGVTITELGTKILRGDRVTVGGQLVNPDKPVYILLNKPKGCVTTTDDPNVKLTVMNLVKGACKERIYPVGRLDKNTTGVLLLTNDGDLASKLTHPMYEKKKIYEVTLSRALEPEDYEKLVAGIELEDGPITPDDVQFPDPADRTKIGIQVHSGRNRLVRRIFEKLNYKVMKLDRVYFAGLTKKGLKRGGWRFLNDREVAFLRMGSFE